MLKEYSVGYNTVISENTSIGKNVQFGNNCIIEENVVIGDNCYIDSNTIIRRDTKLGNNVFIASNCIIGEYQMDFITCREYVKHDLLIGDNSIIRSNSVIYNGSVIGSDLQTGHHVTIRENSKIGSNVSIGTLSDIQGHCTIGNYVRLHSNVHIGQSSIIDDCCWIYPYVVLTNDPTPPSETEKGSHIHSFAVVATNSIVLPGIDIQRDSLIGAGTIVTKDVERYQVVVGNPSKVIGDIREIKNRETGRKYYPWRYNFDRAMPWKNFGFDSWYETLDTEMKAMLLG